MGAKASTANGDDSGSREGTFSADDLVSGSGGSFDRTINLLRSMQPHLNSASGNNVDRQRGRTRSLSSVVPDPGGTESGEDASGGSIQPSAELAHTSNDDHSLNSPLASLNIGRVFAARSLPSHIWSLNGIKCPVCSKTLLPDDVECHIVICLTKPRLMYNEDVLNSDKGECVICLEEMVQGDTIARLPCLCVYHKMCIDQWFNINRSCPEHPTD